MKPPTMTALVAAYNSAQTLPATLASLAAQAVPPDEIVVVNDGSSDGTAGVIERFATAYPALKVRFVHQVNAGPGAARNAGLKMATGDYVAFLDADDTWRPGKIAALKQALAAQPPPQRATIMTHDIATVTAGGLPVARLSAGYPQRRVLGRKVLALTLLVWPWLTTSAVAVDRRAALAVGGFESRLRFGEDWDLWLRVLADPAARLVYLPEVLTDYTLNPAGLSAQGLGQHAETTLRGLEELVLRHTRVLAATYRVNRPALGLLAWAALQRAHLRGAGGGRRRGWLLLRQLWRGPQALWALCAARNTL